MNLSKIGSTFTILIFISGLMFSCTRKKGGSTSGEQENTDEPAGTATGSDEPSGSATGTDEPGGTTGGSDEPGDADGGGGGHSATDVSGLYMGYISLPGKKIKIATEAYLYVIRGSEITEFPVMNAILKLQPGGFGSAEYISNHFKNVLYSYEQRDITLDDAANNLMVTGKIAKVDEKMRFRGNVLVRNSGVTGTIDLELVAKDTAGGGGAEGGGSSDEPGDSDGSDEPGGTTTGGGTGSDEPGGDGHTDHTAGLNLLDDSANHDHNGTGKETPGTSTSTPAVDYPAMAKLAGQYSGTCDGFGAAVLQISTGRDLESNSQSIHSLSDYRITAQLAVKNATCNGEYCTIRQYEEASYDIFTGSLILQSEIADDLCMMENSDLTCKTNLKNLPVTCRFKADDTTELPFKRYKKSHEFTPTAEEKQPIPAVTPPVRQEVLTALSGTFSGYLHHERLDRYQGFELTVQSTISSVNPHNNDVVFVTATASLMIGEGKAASIQKLDQTSYDLALGFALLSEDSDGFLIVQEWTKGYIRGIWVSHTFGKVGIVELIKDRKPELPVTALRLGNPFNTSTGIIRGMPWEISLFAIPQVNAQHANSMMFQGTFRDVNGITARNQIAQGAYDFYSEHLAFISDEDNERMVSGGINSAGQMTLFWPGSKEWGNVLTPRYDYNVFNPVQR